LVTHHMERKAKALIESRSVEFFDFYRGSAFGFVRTQVDRGFYPRAEYESGQLKRMWCTCSQFRDESCPHGLAVYLKAMHWPNPKCDLSSRFDAWTVNRLFQNLANKRGVDIVTGPLHEVIDSRMADYWGIGSKPGPRARRDRRALEDAKHKIRSVTEREMVNRGLPSARISYEDSQAYALAKALYALELLGELQIDATTDHDHRVYLHFSTGHTRLIETSMSIETFLKSIRGCREYWIDQVGVPVQDRALPLIYRIDLLPEGDLEIVPEIRVGSDQFTDPAELEIRNGFYHHERWGYFQLQTGLSPFELTYSSGPSRVDCQEVSGFLEQHRVVLERLDRTRMDPALFEEVVVDQFDSVDLELGDMEGDRVQTELSVRLGQRTLEADELRAIFQQKGRYRKVGTRLVDSEADEPQYLATLLDAPDIQVPRLLQAMGFFGERLKLKGSAQAERLLERLRAFEDWETASLDHTRLGLRPYQVKGFDWLRFLYRFGLGGLLCDQMGLGKTHQAMALMSVISGDQQSPATLVISPASVVYHWHEKLTEFCPQLKLHMQVGPGRDLSEAKAKDVILTTYGTLRQDIDQLVEQRYELVVFDEIQAIKNRATRGFKAAVRLDARCRLGLTGTPVENSVKDLKSLFDCVFPGLLGTKTMFENMFVIPIIKYDSTEAKQRLARMIKPFSLRRSKQDVLTELPSKIETRHPFDLSDYGRELYDEVRLKGRASIEASGRRQAMHIFSLIAKLKQICNHPGLYLGTRHHSEVPSAKWRLFEDLMSEALGNGEKVVVFTQYLGMLAYFEQWLLHQNVGYASISGSTRDRQAQQRRFQHEDDCRVFIGTLGAAGVGIDLTAGQTLIHYDRWWNPAREEQATDRIHRYGQTHVVQIHKLIARHTIEERIDEIIDRKQVLINDLVSFDDQSLSKVLNVEELWEILA